MNGKIFRWIVSTSQSLYFLAYDNTCKMGKHYAVVLLFLIITFVLVMLLIIAYLGLLMCRIYYTEITQTQPHRRSLKRITGFKRSNMSGEDTTTNYVVGTLVWKFMLRTNHITSRHLYHATYEDILMKYNCSPSYCLPLSYTISTNILILAIYHYQIVVQRIYGLLLIGKS